MSTTPPSPRRRGRLRFRKLPRSFYLRPTLDVARDLPGKYFIHKTGGKLIVGRIVEVEAYRENDPASHSYRGMTERNKVMFEEGGHLYVYFTYGMHYCANVVTGRKGRGEAVLIRAVEPVEGIDVMAKNRGILSRSSPFPAPQLTNGPAKVCEAFGITRKHNGIDLCGNEMYIAAGPSFPSRNSRFTICPSPRIGIRDAREKKWRFFIRGNRWVSRT